MDETLKPLEEKVRLAVEQIKNYNLYRQVQSDLKWDGETYITQLPKGYQKPSPDEVRDITDTILGDVTLEVNYGKVYVHIYSYAIRMVAYELGVRCALEKASDFIERFDWGRDGSMQIGPEIVSSMCSINIPDYGMCTDEAAYCWITDKSIALAIERGIVDYPYEHNAPLTIDMSVEQKYGPYKIGSGGFLSSLICEAIDSPEHRKRDTGILVDAIRMYLNASQ